MPIRITKTSTQAKKDKENINKDRVCPECGTLSLFNTVTNDDWKCRRKNDFTCNSCGCEWETAWEKY